MYFLVSFKQHGQDMFIYWMGECDVVNKNPERKIDYDKSIFFLVLSNDKNSLL